MPKNPTPLFLLWCGLLVFAFPAHSQSAQQETVSSPDSHETGQGPLSPQFLPPGTPAWSTEQGVEFNTLLDPLPMFLVQPVVQYYANVGGGLHRAVVFGFRTKVEF